MFSIAICSVNDFYLARLKDNIAKTIGVPFEILIWENREMNIPLADVYNQLGDKAIYPYIIFMHEDIIFMSEGWGNELARIFSDQTISLIGLAGSKYKSKNISGWYSGTEEDNYYNITHRTNCSEILLRNPLVWENSEIDVLTIDGVFMASRRSTFQKIRFDATLLRGFHFYDIDFSLRTSINSRVVVTNSIHIVHETKGGDFGKEWLKYAIAFHRKYSGNLPMSINAVNYPEKEMITAKYWTDYLKKENLSTSDKLKYIVNEKYLFFPSLWYNILKLMLYRPFGVYKLHTLIKQLKPT